LGEVMDAPIPLVMSARAAGNLVKSRACR
jgi:hypothetical protein